VSVFHVSLICRAGRTDASANPAKSSAEWAQWVPDFLALLDTIEQQTGRHIPVTWCCCAHHRKDYIDTGTVLVAREHPDVWKRIRERGDEIGLQIYVDRRNQYIASEAGDTQYIFYSQEFQLLYLQQDVDRLVSLGFDPPKTYSSTGFVWRKKWASSLAQAGFEVDASLVALPPAYLPWTRFFDDMYHADIAPYLLWNHRPEAYPFRPYRCAPGSLVDAGASHLVELPVVGWIGNDFGPQYSDFKNSPPFDLLVEPMRLTPDTWMSQCYRTFELEQGKPFPGLYYRWLKRAETPVDIWPTFFHPGELHELTLQRIDRFIRTLLTWDDLLFSTAHAAVIDWKKHNPTA
jgi:hypothetical protein